MEQVRIRDAQATDASELIEFWAKAGESDSRPSDQPDHLQRLIEHDPQALIIAELDGRIVATIIAGWDGWRANLYRLAVDPELRGRGLGRRMLGLAEDRLRQLGAQRYCAMVLDDNSLGQALWRTSGYQPQGEWRRWVKAAT